MGIANIALRNGQKKKERIHILRNRHLIYAVNRNPETAVTDIIIRAGDVITSYCLGKILKAIARNVNHLSAERPRRPRLGLEKKKGPNVSEVLEARLN